MNYMMLFFLWYIILQYVLQYALSTWRHRTNKWYNLTTFSVKISKQKPVQFDNFHREDIEKQTVKFDNFQHEDNEKRVQYILY
jgi:hypothetical protein